MTKIEWTEDTWNPLAGCSIVSPGCTNCYAMRMAARMEAMGDAAVKAGRAVPAPHYTGTTKWVNGNPVWTGKVALASERTLLEPLRRKKPTMYFVNSMSDLFHESVPDEWIDRVFAVMALCPQHTFQVLTKRSKRMREYMADVASNPPHRTHIYALGCRLMAEDDPKRRTLPPPFPLPNVWLGVSAERQQEADERIPDLLATPAAVRFVSAEPLLGTIDFSFVGNAEPVAGSVRYDALTGHAIPYDGVIRGIGTWATNKATLCPRLDWIIVGGESGPGARPMHPDWARSIRNQCCGRDDRLHILSIPDVAFFFKQWGAWEVALDRDRDDPDWRRDYTNDFVDRGKSRWLNLEGGRGFHGARFHVMRHVGKARAGRLLDGITHDAMPTPAQREVAA